jgi:hypothetical protein
MRVSEAQTYDRGHRHRGDAWTAIHLDDVTGAVLLKDENLTCLIARSSSEKL